MSLSSRTKMFRVEAGLQALLDLAIEQALGAEIERWKEQVHAGTIDGDTRSVLIALGWVTPRDTRVVAVVQPVRKSAPKEAVGILPE